MAKKTSQVSIESLAQMVKRGFDATATKEDLGILGKKTDIIEKKIDGIELRLKTVEAKIDKLPTRSEMVDNATLKKQHETMWKFLQQHFDLRT